jgi:hypothetical protein
MMIKFFFILRECLCIEKKTLKKETWTIEKDGILFHCSYENKEGWVKVSSSMIPILSKSAKVVESGKKTTAELLVIEMINQYKKSTK